ncbi:hypothetical protein SAMN06297358_3672 [Pedobacter xixiisoli]|uniref:Uncharacterized protein n=1 Tax=Pedobacter xixiisoli TaxID=1476464 RepID=A0A286ADI5_9SPHI|nr:hypothetical protein SAMN06297358_3672 [Pedobacter xixiisoli]
MPAFFISIDFEKYILEKQYHYNKGPDSPAFRFTPFALIALHFVLALIGFK